MSGSWVRRAASVMILAVLVVAAAACGSGGGEAPPEEEQASPAREASTAPAAEPEVPERVRKAAAIARAIQADPAAADSILANEGMTREELEELLYEIAADPALSEAYVRALEG